MSFTGICFRGRLLLNAEGRKWMKVIDGINRWVSRILTVVMVLLFIWMIVALSIQVFGRYIFNTGYPWTEEGARYGMIWMVFTGAAYVLINDEHIKITVLEELFKGKSRFVVNTIQILLGLAFVALIGWFSIKQVKLAAMGVSANTGLSEGIPYMVFPIAMAVAIWAYITRLIKMFAKKPETVPAETAEAEGGKDA